jgi:methionyl-tRNA synthetase
MSRQYITTAIDYPNAAPHMGHVLEKVLADVCARWMRLRGDEVRFQIGTDEHGIKIQQTADKEKLTPQKLVDRNVPLFEELYEKLHISADVFIRTTDQKKHWPTVQALWKKLQDAGALEKRSYTGLYCSGCERFLTKKELVDGKCAIHLIAPTEVKEENWFFKLKEQETWLKKILTDGTYSIIPPERANETMALLESGLEDVSFSRPKTSLSWGIPVPGDDEQVMYVWCDALTNYISGLGYFTDHEEAQWWQDATVTHVIGKDIARFHALIWPAMLKHAGVRTPDQLLIHGFLTSEGQKMSKSLGNVVKPDEVLEHFKGNADPLRFYLSSEIPVGNDGDFSWKRIEGLYDAKLRNQLGNLLNRVITLLVKEGGLIDIENDLDITDQTKIVDRYSASMNQFDVHGGINTIFEYVTMLNMHIDKQKPWTLTGKEKIVMLSGYAEALRTVAWMLLPFIPDTAQRISQQLGVSYADDMLKKDFTIEKWKGWGADKAWKKVGGPKILFAPLV